MKIHKTVLFMVLAIACAKGSRAAEWDFYVAPYGWLSGVRGTVVNAGQETDIDIAVTDILENTSGAFQLYTEARRNKLFVAFDGTWAILKAQEEGSLVDLEVRLDQRNYDVRIGYEVHRRALGKGVTADEEDPRERATDVFFGVRYFSTEPRITFILPGGSQESFKLDETRWDPFIGFRSGREIGRRWYFGVRGDIGGFGIGDAARFTWQGELGFSFKVTKRIGVLAGYRLLGYDTVEGSGEDRSGSDLLQHGPFIGAGFKFF